MADFGFCYAFMESNEDALDLHAVKPDECPAGCVGPCWAVSGINSGAFPARFAAIAALPQADRGPAVEAFYKDEFWGGWLGGVVSDDLAARVFDAAVNLGGAKAVQLLQRAINALGGAQVDVDGVCGPVTLSAVNNQNPALLLNAFKRLRYAHYAEYDAGNPALPVLLARAMK